MSSLTRRLQIRGLKGLGYRRAKYRIDPQGRKFSVARGGVILNPEGERIGYRWPRRAIG